MENNILKSTVTCWVDVWDYQQRANEVLHWSLKNWWYRWRIQEVANGNKGIHKHFVHTDDQELKAIFRLKTIHKTTLIMIRELLTYQKMINRWIGFMQKIMPKMIEDAWHKFIKLTHMKFLMIRELGPTNKHRVLWIIGLSENVNEGFFNYSK